MSEIVTELTSTKNLCTAWVAVDGVQAPIYNDKNEGNTITGVIESKNGASFIINLRYDHQEEPEHDLCAKLYVDGAKAHGKLLPKNIHHWSSVSADSNTRLRSFTGVKTGKDREQPFIFSKPKLTDDESISTQDESVVKNLGKIELKVWRCEIGEVSTASLYKKPQEVVIHEQMKKAALSHSVGFGEEVVTEASIISQFNFVDPEDQPLQIYVSRALLEMHDYISADIVPSPTISPPPQEESESESEEDNDEEVALAEAAVLAAEIKFAAIELKAANQKLAAKIASSTKRKGKKSLGGGSSNNEASGSGSGSKRIKIEGGTRVKLEKNDLGSIVLNDSESE